MNVRLYVSPGCQECRATARHLDRLGIAHEVVDVTKHPEALAYVRSLGYSSAPVVVAGDEHWSRYRPSRIERLHEERENS